MLSHVVGHTLNLAKTDASLRKASRDRHLREAARMLVAVQPFLLDGCNNLTVSEQDCSRIVPPTPIERDRILGEKRRTANPQNIQGPHRRLPACAGKKSEHLAACGGDAARRMPRPATSV